AARRARRPGRRPRRDRRASAGPARRAAARARAPGRLGARRPRPRRRRPRDAARLPLPARAPAGRVRARAPRVPRRALPRRLPAHGPRAGRLPHGAAAGPRARAGAMELTAVDVRPLLAEDLGPGDVTSEAVVPAGSRCAASLLLREPGVVCGLAVAEAVFRELDPGVTFVRRCEDGDACEPGELAALEGDARALLAGERTALNLLGRLSGVATLTRRFVDAVAGTGATILDTRKTTPGLRALEKEAVRRGGGANHRFGLDDAILVKENHLRLAGGVRAAVERAAASGLPVEVECETLDEVREALAAGAARILLDNM